jgi:hypothetical protein
MKPLHRNGLTNTDKENKMAISPKPKPKAKPVSKPNAIEKLAQDVTNRYRVTAREARDIVTSVGTALTQSAFPKSVDRGPTFKNIGRQVKETAVAAATGKKGTTSDINARMLNKGFLKGDINLFEGYEKGKKRK